MVAKIRAAVKARHDPDFFLIARTDARGVTGLDDALERGKRYRDSGADVLFPEGLQSAAEFEAFAHAVPDITLLANMTEFGKTPLLTTVEFEQLGYRLVIFPMTAFRAMLFTARSVYADLHTQGTQRDWIERMQTRAELYELIDYENYTRFDDEVSRWTQTNTAPD